MPKWQRQPYIQHPKSSIQNCSFSTEHRTFRIEWPKATINSKLIIQHSSLLSHQPLLLHRPLHLQVYPLIVQDVIQQFVVLRKVGQVVMATALNGEQTTAVWDELV